MRIHGNTSHKRIAQVVFGVIRSQQSCRKYRSTLVSEFELWQLTDSKPLRFSSASASRIFPSAFQVLQGYRKKLGWRETSKTMLALGVPESWMVKPKPSSMPRWGQTTRQQVVRSRGGLKGVVSLSVGPRCGVSKRAAGMDAGEDPLLPDDSRSKQGEAVRIRSAGDGHWRNISQCDL